MTTIQFTLPDKFQKYKKQVTNMINDHNGEYTIIETKDGSAFLIDFENEKNGKDFNIKINALLTCHSFL